MATLLDLFDEKDGELIPRIDKGLVILLTSRSGDGKTCAEFSFPGPIYTFDFDNRIRGGRSALNWLGKEALSKIDYDFYNPYDGFASVDNKLDVFLIQAQQRKLKYKTLCFDSAGSLASMLARDSQRLRGTSSDSFKGKIRGQVKFLHPDDYNYVSTAIRMIMFERIMPLSEVGINVIFSSWIVNQYGKLPGDNEFAPSQIIGEKLAGMSANLAEEIPGYFDEVYRLRRKDSGIKNKGTRFFVEFSGSFSKSSLGLPSGEFDITNTNFYEFLQSKIAETHNKTLPIKEVANAKS